MTRWVDGSQDGRPRGPLGLVRAWGAVIGRPRVFFGTNVTPGDQAPGLTFLASVVLVEETVRYALVEAAYPVVGGDPFLSAILWLLVAVVLVAPAGVHLVAALQTVLLMPMVADRAGVSETVQVLCYATAPCVFAGIPDDRVRVLCVAYGATLYVLGIAVVHETTPPVALAVGALPATLVFGVGFRGLAALGAVYEATAAQVAGLL